MSGTRTPHKRGELKIVQIKDKGTAAEIEEVVYENQRSGLVGGFSTKWLIPYVDKRGEWSRADGTPCSSINDFRYRVLYACIACMSYIHPAVCVGSPRLGGSGQATGPAHEAPGPTQTGGSMDLAFGIRHGYLRSGPVYLCGEGNGCGLGSSRLTALNTCVIASWCARCIKYQYPPPPSPLLPHLTIFMLPQMRQFRSLQMLHSSSFSTDRVAFIILAVLIIANLYAVLCTLSLTTGLEYVLSLSPFE